MVLTSCVDRPALNQELFRAKYIQEWEDVCQRKPMKKAEK